jgi:hypothetical protein
MNPDHTLTVLFSVIVEEAEQNRPFRDRLEAVLKSACAPSTPNTRPAGKLAIEKKRKGGRRTPAVLDPIDLAQHGEGDLREKLTALDLERLLDIVAQYGMDPGKLVMKWKDRERVVDRIIEVAIGRATKGNAFREN